VLGEQPRGLAYGLPAQHHTVTAHVMKPRTGRLHDIVTCDITSAPLRRLLVPAVRSLWVLTEAALFLHWQLRPHMRDLNSVYPAAQLLHKHCPGHAVENCLGCSAGAFKWQLCLASESCAGCNDDNACRVSPLCSVCRQPSVAANEQPLPAQQAVLLCACRTLRGGWARHSGDDTMPLRVITF
jgi:hypothetical protein